MNPRQLRNELKAALDELAARLPQHTKQQVGWVGYRLAWLGPWMTKG